MTDLEHLQTQAAQLTPAQRSCLAAIQHRNFHPCDHPAQTLILLTARGLIHQPARNARWQITPHAQAVLNAPLPHIPLLLGNKAGYTDKPWLAIKTRATTIDGQHEPEPEAVNVEQLHPRWAKAAGERFSNDQDRHDRARRLRRAA